LLKNFFAVQLQLKVIIMKKFIVALALIASNVAVAEEVRLVSADGNPLTELCIAAVESKSRFKSLAQELAISPMQEHEVRCNSKPLGAFVASVRNKIAAPVAPMVVFRTTDESDLSRLCMAALESAESYEAVKASVKAEGALLESEILCNGMPIKNFARKYRNMTAGL
jgi:hypothetical protein